LPWGISKRVANVRYLGVIVQSREKKRSGEEGMTKKRKLGAGSIMHGQCQVVEHADVRAMFVSCQQ